MSKSSRSRILIFIDVKKVPKQPFVMSQWVLKPYLHLHRVSDSIPCQLFCPAFIKKNKQLLANRAAVSAGSQNPSFFPDAENKGLSMLFSGDV